MNLIMFLLKLPWFPVKGFVTLATVIKEEADQQMANPATIRRDLEHAERARESGEMSDEQAAEFQNAAFGEFTRARRRTATARTNKG